MENVFKVPGLKVEDQRGIGVPVGSEADRPVGTELYEGLFRLNKVTGLPEYYLNSEWRSVRQQLTERTAVTDNVTASGMSKYPIDTTAKAITGTLPATPRPGTVIGFYDYAGTWDVNPFTISSADAIEGAKGKPLQINTRGAAVELTYVDDTRGWVRTSGYNRPSPENIRNWVKVTTPTAYLAVIETGYLVELAPSDVLSFTLPTTNVPAGARIVIADTNGTADSSPISITAQSGNVNSKNKPFLMNRVRGVVSCYYIGDDTGWVVGYISETGQLSVGVSGVPVTGNIQARSNTWYRAEHAGAIEIIVPQSAQLGDTFAVHDFNNVADLHAITILQGGDGAYIDRVNAPLIIHQKGAAVQLTYVGTDLGGWVITSALNFRDCRDIQVMPTASSYTPDFSLRSNFARIRIDRNTIINPPVFQQNDTIATTFYIFLDVDATGNYAVALPDLSKGWRPALGSSPLRIEANSVNVIQGVHTKGQVYYTNTVHRAN